MLNSQTLCFEWLRSKKEDVKPSTYNKYEMIINNYLISFFDHNSLEQLNINIIKEYLMKLLNKGLSSSVVKTIKNVLKAIYTTYENQYGLNHIDFSLVKIEEEKKVGAIAEFFIHLYLKINKYEQYCLFQNLEEDKSFKKGFDGLYAINNEKWLVESKSTEKIDKRHHSKISEAYNDLNKKVTGKESNNPWKNAYNHASNRDLEVPDDVRKAIKKLSREYTNGNYSTIDNYNIIPCSTKFFKEDKEKERIGNTKVEVENKIESFEFKKIKAICVNNKIADLFIQYLRK